MLLNYVTYDARRGHQLKPGDVAKVASTAGRLLFAPAQLDLAAMRACLGDNNDSVALLNKWSAMLGNVVPGLHLELLSTRPQRNREPVHHRLLLVANAISASLDLTREFDRLGRAAGHANRGCVSLVPSYCQARMSSHPTVALMQFAGIQLTRIDATHAVRQLASIIEDAYDFAAA